MEFNDSIVAMQTAIIVAGLVALTASASAQTYDNQGNTWTPIGKWNVYGSNGQVCTKIGKTIYWRR
jgi:hypothetical protein